MGVGRELGSEELQKNGNRIESSRKEALRLVPMLPKYSLDDLILPEHIKSQILDVATYSENGELVFKTWGLENTHKYSKRIGVNLWGPPGTGKTMAAHAIAEFLGRKILTVNYADIESKYVGETPKNLCRAFEIAKQTGSILFFDEADAMLSRRVTDMSHSTDASVNQTRSVLLMLLNDYQDIILFATNFVENFDPAFMRRILMHIQFELPDSRIRYFLWNKYIPNSLPNNFDLKYIAETYAGLSGGDISNAVLAAAFSAARRKSDIVSQDSLEKSIKNILESKRANSRNKVKVVTRPVTEEYVKKCMAKES